MGFSGIVCAQDDDEPKGMYLEDDKLFYAGFLAGANFAQVDGDYFAGYRKVGANVGAIAYAHVIVVQMNLICEEISYGFS